MVEWLEPSEITVSEALRQAAGGHPLVAEILARRGITDPQEALAFLDPAHYTPAPPGALPDLETAATLLMQAIAQQEHILIWGDFDVDGQTATALLVDALRDLGAHVTYHVPHRQKHGHGVQPDVLAGYLERGIRFILTCDTGVGAHEAVAAAQAAGATILITDHHALPPTLPDAPAVVNPQRLPPGHPLRDLPGVGVAYKLAEQLYHLSGREKDAARLLDLVALGIVSDVAAQHHDTRYLLQLGINALRYPQRVGLRALMRAAQVDEANLSADTIGFQVGPRLNALGRLDDASRAVELLTTDDRQFAEQVAEQLEILNNRRKQIEYQIYTAAQEQIAQDPALLSFEVLVMAGDHWHPGVIGIVASRLVEQYQRPVVLFATLPGDLTARGSARSVPGVDIGAALEAHADLLYTYGGHPGAAGCSLDRDRIPELRRQLSTTVNETRDRRVRRGLVIDAGVPLGDLSMELAGELNRLAPFGQGNPPVRLMTTHLRVVADAVFGQNNVHRRLTVEDESGVSHVVIWWQGSEHPRPQGVIDLVYVPRINDYLGRRSLQLEWVASRPTPGVVVEVRPVRELVDWRESPDPAAAVRDAGCAVWVEGMEPDELPFPIEQVLNRHTARAAPALAIWTTPPGPRELAQMVELTGAVRFYAIAHHTPDATPRAFLERLSRLIKYALREYGGEASVPRLAAATAQREVTVRRGLDWLATKGQITLEWLDGDRAQITPGGAADPELLEASQAALAALLAEASAYRAHFRRAALDTLFDV